MKVQLQQVLPIEIEKRSMELISQELGQRQLDLLQEPVIKRVIHTTADFDYVDTLCFSPNVVAEAIKWIEHGVTIVTDTTMVYSGINKKVLEQLGGKAVCYIGDEDVATNAKLYGTTRSHASMDKAAKLQGPIIFAIGNAPTALIRLYELITEGIIQPQLIIGVPVGFVNVVESKELIMETPVPYIVAKGRKGGSNVAAAICNSLLYMAKK